VATGGGGGKTNEDWVGREGLRGERGREAKVVGGGGRVGVGGRGEMGWRREVEGGVVALESS